MPIKADEVVVEKHVKFASGDREVKLDINVSKDSIGAWLIQGSREEGQIGFFAQTGKPSYLMVYPKGAKSFTSYPFTISTIGVQIPDPSGGNPKIISWERVFELVKNL